MGPVASNVGEGNVNVTSDHQRYGDDASWDNGGWA